MSTALSTFDPAATSRQVAMLAEYFGVELEPHVLRIYTDGLREVPRPALQAACRQVIATARFMPRVAEIIEAAEATQVTSRAAEQRAAQEAAKRAARGPFTTFGRMSKAAVLHRFGAFVAEAKCECMACWDAQVAGPPRFVPDGVSPDPNCTRCEDRGWLEATERSDGAAPSFSRCACASTNANLVEATRDHTMDVGRWLHGAELREHEQAQQAFNDAMRAWVAKRRMAKETR